MKNLLSIEKLALAEIEAILSASGPLKKERGHHARQPLAGQSWAMIFSKSSTRTRVSFEVAIRELGGQVMFLNANDIQLGRGEAIKDTARVLGRMVHGAIIRTFAQADVEDFAHFAAIPTINALTDDEHPCQILADIFTFEEKRGSIRGKTVALIGDGASNMTNSWIFAAARLGFELRVAAPKGYQPDADILKRAGGKITVTEDVQAAAECADLLYTDVWISMGKEAESGERIHKLNGYQINAALVKLARPEALVM
ncbi:MAG: Ornithine carbamoyltransferase, partial [Pedosphaera sp.]|nr:Ornithine carbamoyltransferase [Pedosphaera sp.]